jgi:hypothetical protein
MTKMKLTLVEAMACALFEKEHAEFRRYNPKWAAKCRAKSWKYLTDGQKAAFVERVRP